MRAPLHPLALLLLAACAAAPTTGPGGARGGAAGADTSGDAEREAAEAADFIQRLAEAVRAPEPVDRATLLNTLEHMLPAWQNEQRRGRERPIEHILTVRVVSRFEDVLDSLRTGTRDRRLVAAWALGFSRVPDNDLGIESPHGQALEALVAALDTSDDALRRNVLLGIWKLGDPATPLPALLDILVQHHDPDVRANAALALTTVLTEASAPAARDAVLLALSDAEPRVRLHAAAVLRRYPAPAATDRLLQLLPGEETPLVRAAMAAALGASGSRQAATLLLPMLGSAREIESASARQALALIFGVDRGADPAAWSDLVR